MADEIKRAGGSTAGSKAAWVWLFLLMLIGAFYAYYYNHYVSGEFRPENLNVLAINDNPLLEKAPKLRLRETFKNNGRDTSAVWFNGKDSVIPLLLGERQTRRLRLKIFFIRVAYGKPPVTVSVNGKWSAVFSPKWEGSFENFSFTVPQNAFRSGENHIKFTTAGEGSYVMGIDTVNIRNYTGIIKRLTRASVTFDENYSAMPGGSIGSIAQYVIFPAAIFLMWIISANVLHGATGSGLEAALRKTFYCHAAGTIPFAVCAMFSAMSPYRVLFFPQGFLVFFVIPFVMVMVYSGVRFVLSKSFKKAFAQKSAARGQRTPFAEFGGVTGKWNKTKAVVLTIARYSGKSAVVAFAGFLSAAGLLLIVKKQEAAEMMADTAYFFLVYGVIMRLLDIRKDKDCDVQE